MTNAKFYQALIVFYASIAAIKVYRYLPIYALGGTPVEFISCTEFSRAESQDPRRI
ncbi:hypothetical protein [Dendronalium sp. ChiSLP03b]|uniref:hypothetical protein n=1 Tax=Dendronalium sp. ChiSLP03b TaxID=3075381 RepID=UPI002AD2BC56|nr:hypothetical protein [Dendronalium sp. ChiSLP03b]MDZ8203572.1 hypothetical protein [Dendronalium sp. ChiSLP03b]